MNDLEDGECSVTDGRAELVMDVPNGRFFRNVFEEGDFVDIMNESWWVGYVSEN